MEVQTRRLGDRAPRSQKMKSIWITLLSLSILCAGCSSLWVISQVRGDYIAPNGDFVEIKKDGKLSWSPISKTREEMIFIGILAVDQKNRDAHVVMPSASPYLLSKFRFSTDYSELRIKWNALDGRDVSDRASVYQKRN
jgi:hypothetical protein